MPTWHDRVNFRLGLSSYVAKVTSRRSPGPIQAHIGQPDPVSMQIGYLRRTVRLRTSARPSEHFTSPGALQATEAVGPFVVSV